VDPDALASLKPRGNVLAIHTTHIREQDSGQIIDASLRGIRAVEFARKKDDPKRAAWVVVANTLLNLDETLTRR
jgi:hypothetical protein